MYVLVNENNATVKLGFFKVILIDKVDISFRSITIQRIKTSEGSIFANSDIFLGFGRAASASMVDL